MNQIENQRLVKNTIIIYGRLILTSIIGLFGSRIIINSLGLQDYGLYNVVGGIVAMMSFLNTVMISTTYRFIAVEMGKKTVSGVNKVFNMSLMIHFCMIFLIILATETIGVYYVQHHLVVANHKLPDALFVLRFSTYTAVLSIISIPYQGLLTATEDFKIQAIIDIVKSVLAFVLAVVIAYYLGNRLRMYTILVAVVGCIPTLLYYLFCKKKYPDIVKWHFQKEVKDYKEMVSFSGWTMFGAAASMGQTTGANLIINSFFGTLTNAAFGIASQVNGIVLTFSNSLGRAALPQITKNFSGDNQDRAFNLTVYVSKFTFYLMLLVALPMLLETQFLLTLWLGKIPPYTVVFCQLLLGYAIINSLNSGLPTLIQATGKIKYFQICISTISLLSLPAAFLLFSLGYPPPTIIVLTMVALLVNLVVAQVLLVKIINFDTKTFLLKCYLPVLYVSLFVIPFFLIRDYFPFGFLRFICLSIGALITLLGAIFFVGIEKQQQSMISNFASQLINKFKKSNE